MSLLDDLLQLCLQSLALVVALCLNRCQLLLQLRDASVMMIGHCLHLGALLGQLALTNLRYVLRLLTAVVGRPRRCYGVRDGRLRSDLLRLGRDSRCLCLGVCCML